MDTKRFLIPFLVLLLLGTRFYFHFTSPKPFNNGDQIRISTTVKSEPIRYENSQYLRLLGLKVYLPLYPKISYGDKIVVTGIVEGDKLKGVVLESATESRGLIYKFRRSLLSFYNEVLPSPHSGLIAGVTIGSKSGIPNEFWESLKNSGTAHVVVASGMNIVLVGGFLLNFFVIFVKRSKALILAILGIWFYAVLSGFDAPIVRSALMGSIALSAQIFGRLNFSLRALGITGVIMLVISPSYIVDPGFLLSFFATLGLILFENKIIKRLTKVPLVIREDLSTTLAAQIGVVPLLFYFFGQFNFLSPFINVLVLWTVVPITILGIVGGLLGLIVPSAGTAVLYLSYPLTLWFVTVVNFFD